MSCLGTRQHILHSATDCKAVFIEEAFVAEHVLCVEQVARYNASIIENVARGPGGAIFASDGSTIEFVSGSIEVLDNDGWEGAGIHLDSSHLYIGATIVLSGNKALTTGGGVLGQFGSSFTIANNGSCNIIENHASSWGGGVHLQINSVLRADGHLNVSRNLASFGGGISLSQSVMQLHEDTEISSNTAREFGGGAHLSNRAKLTSSGSRFYGNRAVNGGGLHAVESSEVTIELTQFRGNVARRSGGGLSFENSALVLTNGCILAHNVATESAGAVYLDDSTFECSSGQIIDNFASIGAGLLLLKSSSRFQNCSLSRNVATTKHCDMGASLCGGGGLLASSSSILLHNSSLRNNTAGIQGRGGAMLLSEAAVLNLTDTVISGNVAGGNGGGVATLLGSSMFASGLQMRDNLAGNHGGALFCGSATRLLLGGRSVVERNTAGLDGGAIYSLSDIMLTQGGQTTLRKNSAREGTGGALAVMESALRMAREHTLDASDNSAGKDGGAVALLGGGSIVLANEVVMNFSGNAAPGNGGAIYRDAYSCTSGRKCLFDELGGYHQVLRFSRNRAGRFGGAAHVACNSLSSRCWSQLGLGQDEEISQTLELHHNVAGFYGSGLSTAPSWIAWDTESGSRPRTVAPGVEVLNVTAKLYDHFGTVVKGTGAVVHFMICASKAEKCTPKSALLPSSAVSIDLQTGLSSAQLDVECLLGSDQVELSATSESAESSDLVVNMTVVCRCGAGQARKTISERQSWICTQCPPDFYVMDPNNHAHQCEKCPAGAVCSEKGVSGKLPESIWSADSETGRYILTSCPAGYSILNPDLHDAQMCMQCQPGWFCKGAADQALKCPTSTHSVEGATKFSDCVDVSFVEIMVTLPLAQFEFQDMQASFRTAIAAAAGTAADMVVISDFFQVDSRRGGDANRMLLSDSRHLDVTVRVAAESRLATIDIAERLNAETVNQNLVKEGIPPGLIKSEPKMIMNPKLPPEFPVVAVTLGIVSILAAVMFLTTIVLWNRWRKASRRLLGAAKGTVANQRDLPHELRGKYRAVKLLGQGGNSIVLQVSQLVQQRQLKTSVVMVHRAVKLIFPTSDSRRKFQKDDIPRLQVSPFHLAIFGVNVWLVVC